MPRPDDFTPALPSARHLPTELLRRYVAGELSAAQEHAVEAHAMECEQCAEVLEGLEMQPAAVTDASLTELRQRLHARVAELATENTPAPAAVPMWWRPLAAAAILLLTLGAVAWLVLRPANRPELAVSSVPATELPGPADAPATDYDGASASAETSMPTTPRPPDIAAVQPRRLPKEVLESPVATGTIRGERMESVAAEAARADVVAPMEAEPAVEAKDVTAAPAGAPQADYATAKSTPAANQAAKSKRTNELSEVALPNRSASSKASLAATIEAAGLRTVRGRVVDSNGQPLPGAAVMVRGASNGISTNLDGSFETNISKSTSEIYVSSIGYRTLTHVLQPDDSALTLTLVSNRKAPNEVMVRREAPPGLPSLGPLPAGGYPAFQQYLRDSLDYPAAARDKRLEGYVRLQFVVGVDGKLTDIRVVSKLSPECDEEAIRLLKEGPVWFSGVQNNRRTARKVELKVPFFLEKR